MQAVRTIGLDIAKSVFQVHGVDALGTIAIRRPLKRRQVLPFFKKLPPCLVGIEACATSQHWSRQLQGLGHTVRLMPPAYVRPYVKSQETMLPMPRRSVKPSCHRACVSWRQRRLSSKAASCFTEPATSSFASRLR